MDERIESFLADVLALEHLKLVLSVIDGPRFPLKDE